MIRQRSKVRFLPGAPEAKRSLVERYCVGSRNRKPQADGPRRGRATSQQGSMCDRFLPGAQKTEIPALRQGFCFCAGRGEVGGVAAHLRGGEVWLPFSPGKKKRKSPPPGGFFFFFVGAGAMLREYAQP